MIAHNMEMVRFSLENPNMEGLKGRYGFLGETWGSVTVVKNLVHVIAYKGAKVTDYLLPDVYDGFLVCSDGTTVAVNDSKLSLDLGADVSAQGIMQLKAVN